jgi:DNA-binding response OmpR family regulator
MSEDKVLGKQVCDEADKLHWNAVYVSDRSSMAQAVRQYDPDLLLIEVINTADLDWWREAGKGCKLPVIFLNTELNEEFLSNALNSGADAFLPKHMFSSRHFEARIRSLLRRQGLGQNKRFIARLNLMVDSEHYTAEINGQGLELTLTEFKILRELAAEDTRVISRLEIQTRVFGQAKLSNRSLDVHVCSVRKKIKPLGLDIDSVRGVGYRLSPCSS